MSALLNVDGYGGTLSVIGSNGNMRARLGTDEYGGNVDLYGNDGSAVLGTNEQGGRVTAYGKDGKSSVVLGVTEHGGYVQIERIGEGKAAMGINEYGNEAVSTWDKNGYRR